MKVVEKMAEKKPTIIKTLPSNKIGLELINSYKKTQVELNIGNITLKPHIAEADRYNTGLTFTVGFNKMYVVKRVDNFLTDVYYEYTHAYGKNLSFTHSLNQFDEISQNLIRILLNVAFKSNQHYRQSNRDIYDYNHRTMFLDSNSYSLFFDLFEGKNIGIDCWGFNDVLLLKENPELTLLVEKSGKGISFFLKTDAKFKFFGDERCMYVLLDDKFYKCDKKFSQKLYHITPFLRENIYIGELDLPAFSSVVLPALRDIMTIEDVDNICEKYAPEDCTPCFYFDTSEDYNNVIATLKFQYRDIEVNEKPTKIQLAQIKQNVAVEERAKKFLSNHFDYDSKAKKYILQSDEETFLTEDIDIFKSQGDVYLSNRLKSLFIDTKKQPVLGVSISNDLLSLDIDTGEFPAEELELLYDSFLKKRKYHKLKDGRFLFLENSGYEKIAEITHMLRLTEKDLKKDTIKLPAYRSLYLDSVLDSNDKVSLKRNKDFRHMMKDFKSIEDSDFQPSEDLNAELRPYQVLGFQWLKTLEQYGFGGILADEMGLGKTLQTITYLLSITQKGHKLPNLIVCPASLLFNWRDELNRFAPSLTVMLLMGNAKEREEQINNKANKKVDVWVTSYDLLKRDREHYEKKKFYACILDEAQHIKNQSTIISRTVKEIVAKQRFVLTGTPIENRLSELWNIFDFLMPGYLFNHGTFLNKLEKPIITSAEPQAKKQLSLLVQPFIMRRLKKDVLKELPDKMEYVRKINLSEEERKIYIAATKKALGQVSKETSSVKILAMLTHLRQLCCDPNLCFDNYKGESSKLEACLELCQSMVENGHRILLFSQFTSMLDILRDRLNNLKISNLTIEGSTTKENRAKYVNQFQKGDTDVFLISLKAGGTGLNLTKADVVIHYDPWWNQAAQNQATDRAHRIGQEEHVQVYKLIVEGSIEEKILKLQEKKASLMDTIFEDTGDTKLSKDDIMDLLEL